MTIHDPNFNKLWLLDQKHSPLMNKGSGGGATVIETLDDLNAYINLDAGDVDQFTGISGEFWTSYADKGTVGVTWNNPSNQYTKYVDDNGANAGGPGCIEASNSASFSMGGPFTAGDLPASACILWVGKTTTNNTQRANQYSWFDAASPNAYILWSEDGSSSTDLGVGTAHYVNGVQVSTRDEVHTETPNTEFDYYRIEGADLSAIDGLNYPNQYFASTLFNMRLGRLIIIAQSEYNANAATIDTLMEALRDVYRTGT